MSARSSLSRPTSRRNLIRFGAAGAALGAFERLAMTRAWAQTASD